MRRNLLAIGTTAVALVALPGVAAADTTFSGSNNTNNCNGIGIICSEIKIPDINQMLGGSKEPNLGKRCIDVPMVEWRLCQPRATAATST